MRVCHVTSIVCAFSVIVIGFMVFLGIAIKGVYCMIFKSSCDLNGSAFELTAYGLTGILVLSIGVVTIHCVLKNYTYFGGSTHQRISNEPDQDLLE